MLGQILPKGWLEVLTALEAEPLGYRRLQDVLPNPRTLSNRLKQLRAWGLVMKDEEGYRLTTRGGEALRLLCALDTVLGGREPRWIMRDAMDTLPALFRPVIERYLQLLVDHFSDRLRSVVVFGSTARGAMRVNASDIDLLVVVDNWTASVWARLDELGRLKERLEASVEFRRLSARGVWPMFQYYPLSTSEAQGFHRIYLDMVLDRLILYDREGWLHDLLARWARQLETWGSQRIQLPGGRWYWRLWPAIKPGEELPLELSA